jgi:hypothetical protein
MSDLTLLRSRIVGPVLARGDAGFVEEVAAWNRTFTHTPEVAVGATSASDVAEAVKFARANGLAVRVQATGHGSHEAITDGVLILTRRLDALNIDPATRIATIGAGAHWAPVVAEAAKHGLAPITGAAGTVGVAGFLLGGGFGPLVRSHGVASDYVRGFEVVTAEGEIVRGNTGEHPELFWALRGGKGGLGVVTGVTIELAELPQLYAGSLIYDADDIEAALRAWIEYTATAAADVTTSAAILRVPDLPFVPAPLRGRTVLAVRFARPGDTATGQRLASPLREAAPVYLDMLADLPPANIAAIHNDPTEPSPGWTLGRLLVPIDQDFATALLARVGPGVEIPFIAVEIRHLGSAAARDVVGGSAVGGRGAEFVLSIVGAPNPALFETVLPRASAPLLEDLGSWISAEMNINFVGYLPPGEHGENAWPADIATRLSQIRAEWDPDGVFAYGA